MKIALAAVLLALTACGGMSDPEVPARQSPQAALAEPPAPLPAPELQALADRTMMTPLAREVFYRTRPELQERAPFTSSCPAKERRQILGCYINRRIFVLKIDQPELATIMEVTAAHEMLHAAYEDLGSEERSRVDEWTADFYEETGSADEPLRELLESYPESERINELHSLLGTQVEKLIPELEQYYSRYFTRRDGVVQAHEQSSEVFEGIERRHAQLVAEIEGLRAQIDDLRTQETAAAAEASQLSFQIQGLRLQQRIEESNALVPEQNAAAGRAGALRGSIESMIDRHNGKVEEINQLVFRQDQLIDSLRS